MAFGHEADIITHLIADECDEQLSGKMKALQSLVPLWYEKSMKVLLFASSTKVLDILERFIARLGYTHVRLDGTVPVAARQKRIDFFNAAPIDEAFVFLISTKAGGLGLNITAANIVVVYDASWNVTHDLQAQDRAYRIGQTKHTDVRSLPVCVV